MDRGADQQQPHNNCVICLKGLILPVLQKVVWWILVPLAAYWATNKTLLHFQIDHVADWAGKLVWFHGIVIASNITLLQKLHELRGLELPYGAVHGLEFIVSKYTKRIFFFMAVLIASGVGCFSVAYLDGEWRTSLSFLAVFSIFSTSIIFIALFAILIDVYNFKARVERYLRDSNKRKELLKNLQEDSAKGYERDGRFDYKPANFPPKDHP